MIYAVGFMVDSTQAVKNCAGSTVTTANFLGGLANCYSNTSTSLTAFPQTAGDLSNVYTKLLNLLCTDNLKGNSGSNKACHYIDNSGMSRINGPSAKDLDVGYGHEQWTNWVVCKNTVDKMGVDTFNSFEPSAGSMVGLIGHQGLRILRNPDEQLIDKSLYHEDWENGKECQTFYAPYDHNFGGIETRKKINFTEGKKYK